ncbi:putative short-chain dehydrogenase/reductase [Xylariomycetidae sp. FL2044]|nr:putative short-chain dehydrogenase/reductase [Xylariomycetidae sp. FL2044]
MATPKKTALITGCSDGGIGAAVAKILRERDYYVFATLRNVAKAGSLRDLSDVEILELDVTSDTSNARCAARVRERTGGTLDVLVNNAGRDFLMPLLDVDIAEAKRTFDVNFWSVLAVTQAFAPMVIEARGVVVNHTSVVWSLAIAWGGIYSTSKAAVKQISEVMRVELEPLGVRVVTSIIGAVDTPILDNSHPGPFQMPPDSYYQPIRPVILDIRAGKKAPELTDVDVLARQLVGDILGGAKGPIWRGSTSTVCRLLSNWLPDSWLDYLNNGARGIAEIRSFYSGRPVTRPGLERG